MHKYAKKNMCSIYSPMQNNENKGNIEILKKKLHTNHAWVVFGCQQNPLKQTFCKYEPVNIPVQKIPEPFHTNSQKIRCGVCSHSLFNSFAS